MHVRTLSAYQWTYIYIVQANRQTYTCIYCKTSFSNLISTCMIHNLNVMIHNLNAITIHTYLNAITYTHIHTCHIIPAISLKAAYVSMCVCMHVCMYVYVHATSYQQYFWRQNGENVNVVLSWYWNAVRRAICVFSICMCVCKLFVTKNNTLFFLLQRK
jgi:hypothetical protein